MDIQDFLSATTTTATTMEDYFSSKEKGIAIFPKSTSLLSIFGSGFIIWDVIRTGKVTKSTRHRILLGMSICDVISSICFFLSTWPIPREEDVYGAIGNQDTCTVQGFFSQFSLTVAFYNTALSCFYVASVRYHMTNESIRRSLEPFLHAIPLLIGFSTSFAGLVLDLYNSNSWNCWIAPQPQGCNESWKIEDGSETNCVRGDNASLYRWVFYYALLWPAMLLVIINMLLVYRTVYVQEKTMLRYNFEVIAYNKEEPKSHDECDHPHHHAKEHDTESQSRHSWKRLFGSSSRLSSSSSITTKKKRQSHQLKHSTEVARQGYLYCGAFFMTWLFPSIASLVKILTQMKPPFPLVFLTAVFVPIQGFFNFLVYIHPRVMERRKRARATTAPEPAWKRSLQNEGRTESINISNKDSNKSSSLAISPDQQKPSYTGGDDCQRVSLGSHAGSLEKIKEEDDKMGQIGHNTSSPASIV